MTDDESNSELSVGERGKLFMESAVLAIPYLGSALERLLSGADTERRWKRLERTLREVGERLDGIGRAPGVESDDFSELLASTARPIASATSSIKRAAFRDLLVNAATRSPTDQRAEEARLAARTLEQIEAPGLEILAKVGLSDHPAMVDTGVESCRVIRSFDELHISGAGKKLAFDIPVVIEWMHRLHDLRTIRFEEGIGQDLADGVRRGTAGFSGVYLTTLGRLLVSWALQPASAPGSNG